MATFRGVLEVDGQPDSAVVSNIEVVGGVLTLHAGGAELGRWNLNDISIEPGKDFFRVVADDEVLLLRVRDAKRFASTVGSGIPEMESGTMDDLVPAITPTPQVRAIDRSEATPGIPAGAPEADAVAKRPGPDESTLLRPLTLGIGGAAIALFVGAFLSWGRWHIGGGQFPIGRLISAVAGLAAGASAYIALAGEKRRDVGLLAGLSALIAIVVIILYAAEAGIGIGFIITIVATVAITALSVLALSPIGGAPVVPEDDPKLIL